MLKVPSLFSQRDPRWAGFILGYNPSNSKYTLGLYGCLLTCFGMYLGKQPNEINDILKANDGFQANTGNFIWSKAAVLGLRQTHLSERWEGPVSDAGINELKSYLDNAFPVIAEIDFNPNTEGEEMHFVLILGYSGDKFQAADPWTGQVINLDVYGGIKRTLIQYRVYDKQLAPEMPVPISTPEQVVPYSQIIIDAYLGMTDQFPSDDEKKYRLGEHLTLNKLIESLSGDSRFYTKYIIPGIEDYKKSLESTTSTTTTTTTTTLANEEVANIQPTPEQPRENPETPQNPSGLTASDVVQIITLYLKSLFQKNPKS